MSVQVVERDRLGALTRVGQGGQGVVYLAANVATRFATSMVYKEYKDSARAEVDFTVLAAMPALVEDVLTCDEAMRLIEIAAWPCAVVERGGSPTGFVMPAIPDQFFVPLTTAKGRSSSAAEFQHLLNHLSILTARGIVIDDVQRYGLLREVASALAFLHKHSVCVGDVSPKNLLFSLEPRPAVFFIDCDAMRIDDASVMPQLETPGWEAPAGEPRATIYSDTYKLGLLALRLLAGDQHTTTPDHLPASTPHLLRQIITDTLTNRPEQRPLPEAWTYILGHAIEHAQHQHSGTIIAVPDKQSPSLPLVHFKPRREILMPTASKGASWTRAINAYFFGPANQGHRLAPRPTPLLSREVHVKWSWIAVGIGAGVIAATAVAIKMNHSVGDSVSDATPGSCVELTAPEGAASESTTLTVVPCSSQKANGRVTARTDDPANCATTHHWFIPSDRSVVICYATLP